MPSMANITVKGSDGTTDVVYVSKTASAGDKIPAVWTADAENPIPGFRPKFQVQTRNNGSNNARLFESVFTYPISYNDLNGVTVKQATMTLDVRGVLPSNVDAGSVQEGFVQAGNLLVSTLIRQVGETGYAPT